MNAAHADGDGNDRRAAERSLGPNPGPGLGHAAATAAGGVVVAPSPRPLSAAAAKASLAALRLSSPCVPAAEGVAVDVVCEATPGSGSGGASSSVDGETVGVGDAIKVVASLSLLRSPFTPREEELEWASVTPDEIVRIESDLRGINLAAGGGASRGGGGSSSGVGGGATRGREAAQVRDEDDAREEALLPALEAELVAMPDGEKGAYLEARRRCPDLVDDEHKKAFLFREDFDANLAATRLAAHWRYRLDLFGPDRCYLPMTLAGGAISGNDLVALSEGLVSLLPAKDANGRSIVYFEVDQMYTQHKSRESALRAFWYLLHVIGSSDPTSCRRGVVYLIHPPSGKFQPGKFDLALKGAVKDIMTRCAVAAPRAVHVVRPDGMFHLINPLFKLVLGEMLRKRYQVHYGSAERVLASLAEFGLTRGVLPEEIGGEVRLDPVRWLSRRMILEGGGGLGLAGASSAGGQLGVSFSPPPRRESKANQREGTLKFPPGSAGNEPDDSEERSSSAPSLASSTVETSDGGGALEGTPKEAAVDAMAARRRQGRGRSSPTNDDSVNVNVVVEPPQTGTCSSRRRKTKEAGGDPRMNAAVDATMANPELSAYDALLAGGFRFTDAYATTLEAAVEATTTGKKKKTRTKKKLTDRQRVDAVDGICLNQRKSQLRRRLRERRKDDPRMVRAVAALREKPGIMSAEDALLAGGFVFPDLGKPGLCDRTVRDGDTVTLFSRKRQLTNKLAEVTRANVAVSSRLPVGGGDQSAKGEQQICITSDKIGHSGNIALEQPESTRASPPCSDTHSQAQLCRDDALNSSEKYQLGKNESLHSSSKRGAEIRLSLILDEKNKTDEIVHRRAETEALNTNFLGTGDDAGDDSSLEDWLVGPEGEAQQLPVGELPCFS